MNVAETPVVMSHFCSGKYTYDVSAYRNQSVNVANKKTCGPDDRHDLWLS